MKIIIDAMGGDNAPLEIVKGALLGMEHWGVEVLLTGDTEAILRALRDCGHDTIPRGMEIVHTAETVEMCDDPSKVFRHKKDTSMGVGLTLLRDGKADALVSAGSTGALLAGATLITKRIRGIRRAAMAPVIPTTGGKAVLIDCGANAECTPEYLVQFAYLGSYYAHRVLGVERPRVGLLNIGTEEEKGRELEHETVKLLRNTPSINFLGYVEGRDAPIGKVDVLVTDGFTGNVFLKACEGMGILMKQSLKSMFFANLKTKIGALCVKKQLGDITKQLDYKTIGGSPLLGTAKPVFKAHGSSDAAAFLGAFRQAKMFVEKNAIEEMTSAIAALGVKEED